jgi:hypothetical protein
LRSLDSAANKAKLSNIANAHFVYDQIIEIREPVTTLNPISKTFDDIPNKALNYEVLTV